MCAIHTVNEKTFRSLQTFTRETIHLDLWTFINWNIQVGMLDCDFQECKLRKLELKNS